VAEKGGLLSFAGALPNGEDAPIPGVHRTVVDSTGKVVRRSFADAASLTTLLGNYVKARADNGMIPREDCPTRSAMSPAPDSTLEDPEKIIAALRRERDETLAREAALAEVLQVINTSPGNLAPVFDAILGRALNLCGAALGYMLSCDGESFRRVASSGSSPALEAALPPPGPTPGSLAERFVRGGNIICSTNLVEDNAYRVGAPAARALVDVGGVRSYAAVALRSGARLLGIIAIYRREVHPFSDKQIALLQNFAAQAVIAMENARLLTETREALEQQTATAEVLQVINSSPGDLTPVFDVILEKAHALCGVGHGALITYDGELFRARATRGLPEPIDTSLRRGFALVPGAPVEPLVRGEPFVQILDMVALAAESPPEIARLVQPAVDSGGRTILMVPLRKDSALLGYIAAARFEVQAFSEEEITLLQNFAAQAVIAMENARLLTETREALDRQAATAEILGIIASSTGRLEPVFEAILANAVRICGGTWGVLALYDGDGYSGAAAHGVGSEFTATLSRFHHPVPGTTLDLVRQSKQTIQVEDCAAEEAYTLVRAHNPEHAKVRTHLCVPMLREDELLGTILIYRNEVLLFTGKQIELIENFAAQAVIAMENARLLGELRERNDEIAGWNRELEARVAAQLTEIERTGKLRRFLAPQLAELIVAQGDESILESHRREIVVVFCDLRGFTGFAERAEPEEVMALLGEYHAALGPIIARFEGTLDHYAGDGIMVFFNDPLPTPEPAKRAIQMAVAMRQAAQELLRTWRGHGHDIGFGVGISQGYATLGQIGFAERMDYTAIGTVTNLAARLCGEATDGQILISRRVATAVKDAASLEEIGDLSLKGLSQAVAVFNVVAVGASVSAP